MTHDERLAIIHQPFEIRYIDRSPWAGCIVGDSFPVGREGLELLTDKQIDPFPVKRDYVLMEDKVTGRPRGKRYVPGSNTPWPTTAIDIDQNYYRGNVNRGSFLDYRPRSDRQADADFNNLRPNGLTRRDK